MGEALYVWMYGLARSTWPAHQDEGSPERGIARGRGCSEFKKLPVVYADCRNVTVIWSPSRLASARGSPPARQKGCSKRCSLGPHRSRGKGNALLRGNEREGQRRRRRRRSRARAGGDGGSGRRGNRECRRTNTESRRRETEGQTLAVWLMTGEKMGPLTRTRGERRKIRLSRYCTRHAKKLWGRSIREAGRTNECRPQLPAETAIEGN
jgi:hypothetical protein